MVKTNITSKWSPRRSVKWIEDHFAARMSANEGNILTVTLYYCKYFWCQLLCLFEQIAHGIWHWAGVGISSPPRINMSGMQSCDVERGWHLHLQPDASEQSVCMPSAEMFVGDQEAQYSLSLSPPPPPLAHPPEASIYNQHCPGDTYTFSQLPRIAQRWAAAVCLTPGFD